MTTSPIFPSFNYIRPIFLIDGRTSQGQPCKDRYQGGIENTDRTLAILEPCKTVAKVATFQVVRHDRSGVVECHNLASARAYASGRLPNKVAPDAETTVKVQAFVSPTGQYYVQHGNQRMNVANASTARYYVKNGVAVSTMLTASLSTLNQ